MRVEPAYHEAWLSPSGHEMRNPVSLRSLKLETSMTRAEARAALASRMRALGFDAPEREAGLLLARAAGLRHRRFRSQRRRRRWARRRRASRRSPSVAPPASRSRASAADASSGASISRSRPMCWTRAPRPKRSWKRRSPAWPGGAARLCACSTSVGFLGALPRRFAERVSPGDRNWGRRFGSRGRGRARQFQLLQLSHRATIRIGDWGEGLEANSISSSPTRPISAPGDRRTRSRGPRP